MSLGRGRAEIKPEAVVRDVNVKPVFCPLEADRDFRGHRMTRDVGQRLLEDPVDAHLPATVHGARVAGSAHAGGNAVASLETAEVQAQCVAQAQMLEGARPQPFGNGAYGLDGLLRELQGLGRGQRQRRKGRRLRLAAPGTRRAGAVQGLDAARQARQVKLDRRQHAADDVMQFARHAVALVLADAVGACHQFLQALAGLDQPVTLPLALGNVDTDADDRRAPVNDHARAMDLEATRVVGRCPSNDEQVGGRGALDPAGVLVHQRGALRGMGDVAQPGAEQLLEPQPAHAREGLIDVAEAAILQDVDAGDGLLDDTLEGHFVVVQFNVQFVRFGHDSGL